ncbi:hypothetical protein [Arthrobacter sp. KK5.5]|uniref:hypothetical protein n=1 Tax=Arthrobacter sp. KK5.5 TaxID=3373084 RepID=UPI003EE4EC63
MIEPTAEVQREGAQHAADAERDAPSPLPDERTTSALLAYAQSHEVANGVVGTSV